MGPYMCVSLLPIDRGFVVRFHDVFSDLADTEWALVLLEHPDEGGNVLTKASVDVLWELDAKIKELEVRNLWLADGRHYRPVNTYLGCCSSWRLHMFPKAPKIRRS